MARQFIVPQSDASVYEQFPTRNVGVDEILEVGKSRPATGSIRGLIQFDVTKFDTMPTTTSASFFLNLRIATMFNR